MEMKVSISPAKCSFALELDPLIFLCASGPTGDSLLAAIEERDALPLHHEVHAVQLDAVDDHVRLALLLLVLHLKHEQRRRGRQTHADSRFSFRTQSRQDAPPLLHHRVLLY